MARTRARITSALAAALMIVTLTPASSGAESLSDVKEEISQTRARMNALVNDDRQVIGILNDITSRLNANRAELADARGLLHRINLHIRTEQRRLTALQARAKARQAMIDARARALYISGPTEGFQALFEGGSVSDNLTRAAMIEIVASVDQAQLERLAVLRNEAMVTRAALRDGRARAVTVHDEIAERVSIVAELAAVQREAHAKLSGRIQAARSELAALEREQQRIEDIIASRSGGVSTGPSSSLGFAWPIRGLITSPYGPRWGGFHTGMDIDCDTGEGIGASKAGRVIASEWGGGYGNMIIIDHGGGYTTLYAHMSRLYVGRGAKVVQGSRIGACGTTGNSTGDHLHFEVRVNGSHRNPRPYLP